MHLTRRSAVVAPLAASFAVVVSSMAWVASSDVCMRPIEITANGVRAARPDAMSGMNMNGMSMAGMSGMAAMPGMTTGAASAPGGVMLCPVVLGLLAVTALLAAWAIVALARDPHRTVNRGTLVRLVASLPLVPTTLALAAGGALAIGTIVAVDGGLTMSTSLCALLALILAGGAAVASATALLLARLCLALCNRIAGAFVRAIATRRAATRAIAIRALRPRRPAASLVVFGRGLRAPPFSFGR